MMTVSSHDLAEAKARERRRRGSRKKKKGKSAPTKKNRERSKRRKKGGGGRSVPRRMHAKSKKERTVKPKERDGHGGKLGHDMRKLKECSKVGCLTCAPDFTLTISTEKKVYISSEMPWPVKSGLRKDVNEQNVVAFYHNALPGSSANEFYKIMQQECLIWHPDKIYQFIASLTLTTPEEESMAVIARMVIKLHKDFRRRRTS
jgi:hypothetical protein